MKPAADSSKRKPIVLACIFVIYVTIGVVMLFTGRAHTILIDNKEAEDGSYAAVDGMAVSIDSLESSEYYPGDRDMAKVKGQRHRIRIEQFSDGTVIEKSFKLPLWEDLTLLSVPRLLAGIEPYTEKFVPATAPPQTDEQQQYTSLPAEVPPEAAAEAPPEPTLIQ